MLSGRLGLGCKQPHLFQLNIIKVIKCLKIHADFMPAWLQPRCICCESPLRMVGELGAVLSQSLKGVALGGFVPGFGSPAFYGMKTLQKENATRQSYGSLRPTVAVSGNSKSMAGASWYLGLTESADVLVWKTTETVALQGEVRFCSAGFLAPAYKVCPVIIPQ